MSITLYMVFNHHMYMYMFHAQTSFLVGIIEPVESTPHSKTKQISKPNHVSWLSVPVALLLLIAIVIMFLFPIIREDYHATHTSQSGPEKDTCPVVPTWSSTMSTTSQSGSEKDASPVVPTRSSAMSTTFQSPQPKTKTKRKGVIKKLARNEN